MAFDTRNGRLDLTCLALALALAVPSVLAVRPASAQGTAEAASGTPARATVAVSGYGEASAAPDQASLTFSVVHQAETAKGAVDAGSAAMSGIIAGMRELGAEDRDLQTANFQIFPQYGQADATRPGPEQTNEIVGYEARNTLSVTVRRIEEVGAYLDKAIDLGVNQGGDVRFEIEDDSALLAEARRAAIEDAKAKARLYAEAAGVSLGQVMAIAEPSVTTAPQPEMMKMRMAADSGGSGVPIEAGELTRSASIEMVFAITR
ncbi:SIMPL domain-containing protein [Fulvimarina sp. 2208YS6-2-32]|uniref:SIMPL domain-containing protein n=1 Tax=Fulvimarina uroteuthidis TaxID=3098149 RepID=A0ABU5I1E6_9HYPH|nr:SIMPL domain-containing protein [Fulvimarina sp. 2208YS6-2-32]MDY8109198.1 SIMPL domain-containing protein [Fulvimarina sp. 2208YS6-2-32]